MDNHEKRLVRRAPDQRTWYVVATAFSLTDAEIPAGLLRSAGIPVYLAREAASAVMGGIFGGVQVAVPEAYYAEALALLEADTIVPDELEAGDDLDDDTYADDAADDPFPEE